MKLLTAVAILSTFLVAPAQATTVYTSFCLPCGIGSQRLLFSSQTPDGFTLTGITESTGDEVSISGDGQDVLEAKGGGSAIRAVGSGFSDASFNITGAGFRELMLWIGVSGDVPLTLTVNGTEILGPFTLHNHGFNFIDVQVPQGSLMTLVTLRVPGDYFTSFHRIRIGGITDLDLFGGASPEPDTVTLILSGLAVICFARRAKLRARAAPDG